ncbi:OmpA family protein [Streptomyces sp. OF3]|uniref:OmpA family protein n=1 Tax=Streptomyces alkaliterrae TaxID=2213162 RepID=A0A7W3WPV2_9ACTN|nr:OmpA family protein [Streptomyces alkaliterrae]
MWSSSATRPSSASSSASSSTTGWGGWCCGGGWWCGGGWGGEGGAASSPPPGGASESPSPGPTQTPGGGRVAEERREESNEKTKFTLQAEVLFDKNSSKLNAKANARIADIAAEINKQKASKVSVYGFTDNLGSYENGVRLSQERAEAVHKVLVKTLNDASLRFDIRGYSEDYPIASNATEEGRAQNRRVEISFSRAN